MIKVFISQPMRGLSDEDILKERKRLFEIAKKTLREDYKMMKDSGETKTSNLSKISEKDIELVDSFFEDAPDEEISSKPVWYLGNSIQKLSEADVAIFGPHWEDARGCIIEHEICLAYDITIIESYSEKGE